MLEFNVESLWLKIMIGSSGNWKLTSIAQDLVSMCSRS